MPEGYGNIYKKNWTKVADKTAVKQAELDQAENLADQLVTAVGEREQAPVVAAAAIRDRQAAFTLFINDYDEVGALISYLRRKQGDVPGCQKPNGPRVRSVNL